jgi:hypothetical protein
MAANFDTLPYPTLGTTEPYHISIPGHDMTQLKTLLSLSEVAPKMWYDSQTGGQFGMSRDWLIDTTGRWLHNCDRRKQEARINSFPNFTTTVKDANHGVLDAHFIGLFCAKRDAVLVTFLRGWPGSVIEFIPMLALIHDKYTPETMPYHVVVPSLPGYSFSVNIGDERESMMEAAVQVLKQLMVNLGFGKRYVAQGGDIGSMLSLTFLEESDKCKAIHGMAAVFRNVKSCAFIPGADHQYLMTLHCDILRNISTN